MAIINNNVQNVRFLRNAVLYGSREAARNALTGFTLTDEQDGSALLARYSGETATDIKTLVGFVYAVGGTKTITIFDIEGSSSDVENLRNEINAKLGEGVTSANTVTDQLTVLSGTAQDTSATTSVAGAKKYTDDKIAATIDGLDYSDTAVAGEYVSQVTEADGVIAVTRVALPDAASVSGDSKVVIDVTQDKGQITATAANLTGVKLDGYAVGTDADIAATDTLGQALGKLQAQINAMDKTADAVDGQVVTTVAEEDGKVTETKANVKDLQLGGYVKTNDTGDIASADTINVALSKLENKSNATTVANADGSINVTTAATGTDINVNIKSGEKVLAKDGNAGLYTDLDLVKITTGLPETVKERYQLLATDDTQIGVNIDVPKDSHIVSINYITGATDPHYQNLEYVYIDASGATQTTYVDMSELVLEAEFASGVTVTNHIAHGVVDPTSEGYLTVGENGFKLSGIDDAISGAYEELDATVTGETANQHISISIEETDGKLVQSGFTITENNIANADDLATLSGKTITAITSSNGSITAAIDDAAGNKSYDIETDADKIKMSGFTGTGSLSGITEGDSIATAFEKVEGVIDANGSDIENALEALDERLDAIESGYVETVKVNGVELAETDGAVNVQISSTPASGTTKSPITVDTDNSTGAVTLKIDYIDAGTY